jgi:hypothetical protein
MFLDLPRTASWATLSRPFGTEFGKFHFSHRLFRPQRLSPLFLVASMYGLKNPREN